MAITATIIGGAVAALGTLASARASSNAAKYNTRLNQQNAALAQQTAAENERRQRIIDRKNLGAMRAAFGASGVTMEGSPMDVLEESAMNAELNALTIRHGGAVQAVGYRNAARLDRSRAGSAMVEGGLSAAGQLLATGADAYDRIKLTRT